MGMPILNFDDSWKFWIWDNVRRGSPKKELASILLEKGFDKQLIINELGVSDIFEPQSKEKLAPILNIEKIREKGARQISEDLLIFEVEDFLAHEDCDAIIEIIRQNSKRSSVIDYDSGGNSISDFRTSSTANLYRNMGEIVNLVENSLLSFLEIPEKFTEQIQGQRYQVGQQFKPHFDTLFPTSEEIKKAISRSGNRTWTAMIYLNDVEEGGETLFTKINLSAKPEKGKLLIWQNTANGQNVPNSMHWGTPVIKGEKFVITKWFREKVYQNI
jgi:prolyl 4-hydroxylase